MNRKLFVIIIILILLAIPATLMLVSGELFPEPVKPYKVAVVTDTDNIGTIYVRTGVAGVELASRQSELPIASTLYVAKNATDESFSETFYDALAEGEQLIVIPGFQGQAMALNVARNDSNLSFVTVDGQSLDGLPSNYANIAYRSNEPSFVAGYLAGMMSDTDTLGFLGGVQIDSVTVFYYGFKAGIDVASAMKNKPITLISSYANSFVDEDLGYQLASNMYAKGADNVFTVAGDTGLGGIQAAKDMDKYVIGVDVDQNYLAPKNVLCSVVKDLQNVIATVVLEYAGGNDYDRQQISVGYAENSLGLASIIDAVPPELLDRIKKLEDGIAQGIIVVPGTEEEYNQWSPAKAIAILND
ncbi:MAG TPA: BMP family ABC transporter substrate-binding protein [Methanocorpusculum sp.]|nr:BMP family ABC transporter substrate-binding protein [Methanocorpusculum sp.]